MTRIVRPFIVDDISTFCKKLARQLESQDGTLGHQRLLNIVVKSAGYKNFQQFTQVSATSEPEPPADFSAVDRALRHFDSQGRLSSWPSRRENRALCLWALWAHIPRSAVYKEREISDLLNSITTFEDAAHWRRALVEEKLVVRNASGSQYRRVHRQPSLTARALLRALKERR